MAGVSVTPELLATVREPVFVVAGPDKAPAVQRLIQGDPTLVAWQAVQGCEHVELWVA
jgi:6-phosphogluconolactonase/glucosamine-6-phosphate isomerase/deaminase